MGPIRPPAGVICVVDGCSFYPAVDSGGLSSKRWPQEETVGQNETVAKALQDLRDRIKGCCEVLYDKILLLNGTKHTRTLSPIHSLSHSHPPSHYAQTSIVFDQFASAVYDVGDYPFPASYIRTNMDPFVSISSPSATLNLNALLALLGIPQYTHTRVCICLHVYV
jgi:hypothetical protein